MTHKNGVFTIPPHAAFLPNLASFLLAESHANDTPLTQYHIYLPTRRACRALADAFLNLTDGTPLLLPTIRPIGDSDEDDIDIHLSAQGMTLDLPPALTPLRRQMLLAQLIHKLYPDHSFVQVFALAQQLGFLLDQVMTEELSFDRLVDLVPENFAQHWGITLSFLTTLSHHWPLILEAENALDASTRRIALLRAQAALWETSPPTHPIIFAGSTGSIPATRHLMKVVSRLPHGRVILPGLDTLLPGDEWDMIPETHPQYTMKQFLDSCGITRTHVSAIPLAFPPCAPSAARCVLISESLSPEMRASFDISETALENLCLITAKTARDEATAIALHMREVLETPDLTACLITPNRLIGQRVAQILKRWDIDVDDTAGKTLLDAAACDYFHRLMLCVREHFAPSALLEFLHHPFHAARFPRETVYAFEKDVLRTPRSLQGLESLMAVSDGYHDMLNALRTALSPLYDTTSPYPLSHWISLITTAAGHFVTDEPLWNSEGGEDLLQLFANLHDESRDFPAMNFADAMDILVYVAGQTPLRTAHLTHPRLTILGQLESRLMRADVMILAGLNEGIWPEAAGTSPFLSRPMRKDFGLPGLERSLGLSAHDFVAGFCASRVILSRSEQDDGAATTPARWLQRIDAVLKRKLNQDHIPTSPLMAVAQYLDTPDRNEKPLARPAPLPPPDIRPREIAATRLQMLQENPYRFYGEKILHITALEDLESPSTAAQRGIIIHSIMEAFIEATRDNVTTTAPHTFLNLARDVIAAHHISETDISYWWPRLERLAHSVTAYEQQWRRTSRVLLLEAKGKTQINTENGAVIYTAKADRIDQYHGGGAIIIDYKTGVPPSKTKVKDGRAPQLPLEALILSDQHAGFDTHSMTTQALRYVRLSGGRTPIDVIELNDDEAKDAVVNTAQGIVDFTRTYLDPRTAFTAMMIHDQTAARSDIRWWNHLSRAAEWAVEDDADTEDAAA
jgi:ATP-dependent helicase/nuclease subunit B